MKKICVILFILISWILVGCITDEYPSNHQTIIVEAGTPQVFEVVGPGHGTITRIEYFFSLNDPSGIVRYSIYYKWYLNDVYLDYNMDDKRKYEFIAENIEDKGVLTCICYERRPHSGGQISGEGADYHKISKREWTIEVVE